MAVPTEKTKKLMELLGYKTLYPPQEKALKAGIESGKSIVVASPTASGKTFIALAAIVNRVAPGDRAFYTVPLRSIAYEKYNSFKIMSRMGLSVRVSVGDYSEGSVDADILVTTYEKLDSIIRNNPDMVYTIKILVVDEVHYVGEPKRGPVLESLIARILSKADPQVIALSATIPNAKEIADWLNADLIIDDWRPVPLREGVFKGYKIIYSDGETSEIEAVTGIPHVDLSIDSSRNGGQTLVFSQSRKRVTLLAKKSAQYSRFLEYDEAKARDYAREIRHGEGPSTLREELSELIARGVSYHHAGLSTTQRKIIEEAFRARALSIIHATPTLAAGVNLPARRVVVDEYTRFEEGFRRPISIYEYKQLAGRAGRPGLDPYGEAVIIASSGDEVDELMEEYILSQPEPVESKLYGVRGFRHSVLGVVASGMASSIEDVVEIHLKTLYAMQRTPSDIARITSIALRDLIEWGLIYMIDNEKLAATPLGYETSRLYLDPEDVVIVKKMSSKITPDDEPAILYMIALLPDMPRLPVTRREEEYLMDRVLDDSPSLLESLEWIGPEEARALKVAFLLYDWINEVNDDELLSRYNVGPGDLAALIDTSTWLLSSIAILTPLLGLHQLEHRLKLLEKRVKHGVKPELLQLVAVPGIGRIRARRLYEAGYKALQDLMLAEPAKLARIPGIGPGVVRRILEFTGRIRDAEKYKKLEDAERRGLLAFIDSEE
ncbi:MAG: DEAD/DEAH box helicase [Desulfurococcales archaeon]|nr:DEAD/DEAH box helicase [Desulfurococcales archaeon]